MKKLSLTKGHLPIVGGTQAGHAHLNAKNHASGLKVPMPLMGNISGIGASRISAKRAVVQSIKKGYGK